MQEDKHYYTNTYKVDGDTVDVDRIYTLDADRFSGADYAKLGEIYMALSGYINDADTACWFGKNHEKFCLWASWEPPGLQIAGHVPLSDFSKWEKQFHDMLVQSGLPFKNK